MCRPYPILTRTPRQQIVRIGERNLQQGQADVVHGYGVVARVDLDKDPTHLHWDPLARYERVAAPPAEVVGESIIMHGKDAHFSLRDNEGCSLIYCVNEAPLVRADVNETKAAEEDRIAQFARDCAVKARDVATAEWFDAVEKGHTKSARELREIAERLRNQAKVLPGKGNPNVKWKIDLEPSAGCFSPRLGLMVIAPIAAGEELLTAYDQSDNKKNARAEADATIALLRRHMKATERSSPAAPPEVAAPPQDSDEEPEPTQLQPELYDEDTDIEMEYAPKGLTPDIVRLISEKNEEPDWMTQWRLDAYAHWLTKENNRKLHY